jgi:hypothetical protein
VSQDHLDAETRLVLAAAPGARVAWFQSDFWISYPAAEAVLVELNELVIKPRRGRMSGLLVTSESNNGKSEIAKRLARAHPPQFDDDSAPPSMPLILFEMMPAPTEAMVIEELLETIGLPFRPKDDLRSKRRALVEGLKALQLRVLVIDELQRLLGARREQRPIILDLLRYIGSQIPVPLVAFSTPRGAGALATSDETINRLRPTLLPRWALDPGFQRLLAAFERRMPLPEPSGLAKPGCASLIHELTEGLLGEVYDLLELALRRAVADGSPAVTAELIRSLSWTKPGERKKNAKAMEK